MNRKLPTAAALAVVPLLLGTGSHLDRSAGGYSRPLPPCRNRPPSIKAGQHLDQSVGRRPGRDRLFEQFERLAPAPCRLV